MVGGGLAVGRGSCGASGRRSGSDGDIVTGGGGRRARHWEGRSCRPNRNAHAHASQLLCTHVGVGGGLDSDPEPGLVQWCRLGAQGADLCQKSALALILASR